MAGRVLLVSRDDRLSDWLADTISTAGWSPRSCSSSEAAVELIDEMAAVMVVADITSLPVTEAWADAVHRSGARVVALSTKRREGELEAALGCGADSFIQCPVGPHELVARMRALARRPAPARFTADLRAVQVGSLRLLRDERAVEVGDVRLDLSRREVAVLDRLAAVAPLVVSREDLSRVLWMAEPGLSALDPVVRRLRFRLESAEGWRRIETVRGVGFRMLERRADPVSAERSPDDDGRPPFTLASIVGNEAFGAGREPSEL